MVKIYTLVAGNTLGAHEKLLKKLCKGHRFKEVKSPEESDVTVVFCPIVSRFETDVTCALSKAAGCKNVVLMAMHHTYNPDYTVPSLKELENRQVILSENFLFHEKHGLLRCPHNKMAIKKVRKQLKKTF